MRDAMLDVTQRLHSLARKHSMHHSMKMLLLASALIVTHARADSIGAQHGQSQAIVQGAHSESDHAVAALLIDDGFVCTGVLIAERVLLTAAHCLDDGSLPSVHFGAFVGDDGEDVASLRAALHPEYALSAGDDEPRHDLALLWLVRAPRDVTPVPILERPEALVPGTTMRIVGYGSVAELPERTQAEVAITRVTGEEIMHDATGPHICHGDSGGPALISVDGREVVAGIAARGDAACTTALAHTRVDVALDNFIRHFPEPRSQLGERCHYEDNCAEGMCVQALETLALDYCSTVCASDRDCPDTMRCTVDESGEHLCRRSEPLGMLGSRCEHAAECVSGQCIATTGDDRHCVIPCFADNELACPEGFACEGGPEGSLCVRASTIAAEGCAVRRARSAVPNAWTCLGLLASGALGLRTARRRRAARTRPPPA